MNRFLICGAPCAGKSRFALENLAPGELLFDYDRLQMALSGQESHAHFESLRPYVNAAREAIFHDLEAHKSAPAWVITSSPKRADILNLSQRLELEIIYLPVEPKIAHGRAEVASRPEIWHTYIDNWFDNSDIDADFTAQYQLKTRLKMRSKKIYTAPLDFKAEGEPGEFKAVFATLNVKDLDGDVTPPGAFREGQAVIIEPWNHGYELPAGKGVIHANGEEAWIEGAFFLDTETGRENYQTVKNMGDLAEWSYTFNVVDQKTGEHEGERVNLLLSMDVIGVSPVTRGAGLDTRTLAIKRQKQAFRPHETATTESNWDGPENESRVRSGESLEYYAQIYAWRDPDGDEAVKSTYRFIHHEISEAGEPGAANVRACQTGIGVLNGARGGTTIPEADLEGVYNHLAAHLEAAEVTPPAFSQVDAAPRETGNGKRREQLIAEIGLAEVKLRVNQLLEVDHE